MIKKALIWISVSSPEQATEEKDSLDIQEREARAWCAANNHEVIELLEVRGFPRSESDVLTFFEDMEKMGELAYKKLRDYWHANRRAKERRQPLAFDTLVAWHQSRFGRSNSLYSQVVENVVASGAEIKLLHDVRADIKQEGLRTDMAWGGIQTASEIDTLKLRNKFGLERRVENGLGPHRIPFSHYLIRDARGKATGIAVNPAHDQLFTDVRTIILGRAPLYSIEDRLWSDYRHADPLTGKPWRMGVFRALLFRPTFWGHSARYFSNYIKDRHWVYDDQVPVPDGVIIFRDVIDAVWPGEIGQEVIEQLRRSRYTNIGKSRPLTINRFSGLLYCSDCGRRMTFHGDKRGARVNYWYCTTAQARKRMPDACHNTGYMPEDRVVAYIERLIDKAIERGIDAVFTSEWDSEAVANRIEYLAREIAATDYQVDQLINELSRASKLTIDRIRARLEERTETLTQLTRQLADAKSEYAHADTKGQVVALAELMALRSILWQQDGPWLQSALDRFLGSWRIGVLNKEIAGLLPSRLK